MPNYVNAMGAHHRTHLATLRNLVYGPVISAKSVEAKHLEVLAQWHLLAFGRDHGQDIGGFGILPTKLQPAYAIKAFAQMRLHCRRALALQKLSLS